MSPDHIELDPRRRFLNSVGRSGHWLANLAREEGPKGAKENFDLNSQFRAYCPPVGPAMFVVATIFRRQSSVKLSSIASYGRDFTGLQDALLR
jgi:hypothetical protein